MAPDFKYAEHAIAKQASVQFHEFYSFLKVCAKFAGRAAEELVYGADDMSTINQRSLAMARRIVQKLVVSGGLSGAPGLPPAPLSVPVPMDGMVGQIVPRYVRHRRRPAPSAAPRKFHRNFPYSRIRSVCLEISTP